MQMKPLLILLAACAVLDAAVESADVKEQMAQIVKGPTFAPYARDADRFYAAAQYVYRQLQYNLDVVISRR